VAKQNLLLVDADARSLRVLEVSLRKAGYSVTTCGDVGAAMEMVELSRPDLVISDTRLPKTDGFTLVEQLRENADWEEIPFIFLSSDGSLESKVKGLELGVEDYLTKPIYIKEIITRVNLVLQRFERRGLERRSLTKTRFSGSLAEMGLVDLLQTIDISRKSGVLLLTQGEQSGEVLFSDGALVHAEFGKLRGEAAIYRFLVWNDGEFNLEFGPVDPEEISVTAPTQVVLMEGMRRLDEWGRILEQLPPLTSVFEVDDHELIERLAEIPDDINVVLRHFDGHNTLLDVVDEAGGDDLATLLTLSKLFFEGLIVPRAPDEPEDVDVILPGTGERADSNATLMPPPMDPEGIGEMSGLQFGTESAGTAKTASVSAQPGARTSTPPRSNKDTGSVEKADRSSDLEQEEQHPMVKKGKGRKRRKIAEPSNILQFPTQKAVGDDFVEAVTVAGTGVPVETSAGDESAADLAAEAKATAEAKAAEEKAAAEAKAAKGLAAAEAKATEEKAAAEAKAAEEKAVAEAKAEEVKATATAKAAEVKAAAEAKAAEEKAAADAKEEKAAKQAADKKAAVDKTAAEKADSAKADAAPKSGTTGSTGSTRSSRKKKKKKTRKGRAHQAAAEAKESAAVETSAAETSAAETGAAETGAKPSAKETPKGASKAKAKVTVKKGGSATVIIDEDLSATSSQTIAAITATGEHAAIASDFFSAQAYESEMDNTGAESWEDLGAVALSDSDTKLKRGVIAFVVVGVVAIAGWLIYQKVLLPQPVDLSDETVSLPSFEPTPELAPEITPEQPEVAEIDNVAGLEPVTDPEATGEAEVAEVTEGELIEGTEEAPEGTEVAEITPDEPVEEPEVVAPTGNYAELLEEAMNTRNRRSREEKLREAVAANANGSEALAELAWALLNRNQFAEAAGFAERASTIDPTNSKAWITLGAARQATRDADGARAAYEACVAQGQGRYVSDCRSML
jgi:DNA-binding response OmpR family regulator